MSNSSMKFGYSPGRSEKERVEHYNEDLYHIRFRRKDLRDFDPTTYITGNLNYQDIVDLKEVFDTYDQANLHVLLPNDLKLLLTQNGFQPGKKTVYEMIAQFDAEEAGGINFSQFLQAMDTKPYIEESKR